MFSGNYSSWQEVLELCTGYDAGHIAERVREGVLKVKAGEAAYEMDSIAIEYFDYRQRELLAHLLKLASSYNNRLRVLDFGGALGSTYFQLRNFLHSIKELRWCVVEQPHFVEIGQQEIAEGPLVFYRTIKECVKAEKPQVILFSGVVQYLESPYDFLAEVLKQRFPYMVFDRTPMFQAEDRITYQDASLYDASYPAWFFNEEKFIRFFEEKYELLHVFDSFEWWELEDTNAQNKGFVFKRR